MIIEQGLLEIIQQSLDRDLKVRMAGDYETTPKFKSYLKRDYQPQLICYSLVDEKTSIKCYFEPKNLREYLARLPSYIRFENFDSKFLLI